MTAPFCVPLLIEPVALGTSALQGDSKMMRRGGGYRIFCVSPRVLLRGAVHRRRQARDPNPAMPLVANVESDEQRGDLLDDPGVFQFAAIDRAYARNLGGEIAYRLRGARIIAADDHVALDRAVAVQNVGRTVLKSGHHGYT